MRLTTDQVTAITHALTPFIASSTAELRLYGSRVDDSQKGGDIDLLLITAKKNTRESLNIKKHHLLTAVKRALGDRKIDLTIITKKDISDVPFLQIILPTSIFLYRWN